MVLAKAGLAHLDRMFVTTFDGGADDGFDVDGFDVAEFADQSRVTAVSDQCHTVRADRGHSLPEVGEELALVLGIQER